jgi:MFS family permease
MAFNVTLWSLFLCWFAACHNFAGLAILRVGLGACEGSITAGFMIVTSMVSREGRVSSPAVPILTC